MRFEEVVGVPVSRVVGSELRARHPVITRPREWMAPRQLRVDGVSAEVTDVSACSAESSRVRAVAGVIEARPTWGVATLHETNRRISRPANAR